jgi:nicotinate-nucleotide--dimethylbenzimidazole phosphoribosyltransferase
MEGNARSLKRIIDGVKPVDEQWVEKARERTAALLMPSRALGRLHEISERICGIRETLTPSVERKAVIVMAGDHGVVSEGVSAYPQEITGEMVRTFLLGGAGINVIARHVGAEVWVVDMGIIPLLDPLSLENGHRLIVRKIGRGTANFTTGPAMGSGEAEAAILAGFRFASTVLEGGIDILGTGDMGIGNTTASSAVGAVITGAKIHEMVGRGTGVDDEGLRRKQDAIRRGLEINRPDPSSAIDVLTKVGGYEIGGIAGAILAGAVHRRPVVIDGLISTAGALVAHLLCPRVVDYLFAGHRSEERGHGVMLSHLGLEPVLDLGMRLGEGTGAALAMGIIEATVRVFREVLTFEEAGVPGKSA